MSKAYFPGWGTVHMWDRAESQKRAGANRRVSIEAGYNDKSDEDDTWFSGRVNLSRVGWQTQPECIHIK